MIFLLFAVTLADQSNDIGEFQDPGDCVCDLTYPSCDQFCCCDPDCPSQVTEVWESDDPQQDKCLNQKFTQFYQLNCVRGQQFFQSTAVNSRYSAVDEILCLEFDNSESIGYFHQLVEDEDVSSDTINTQIEENVEYSDTLSTEIASTSGNLVFGDPMRSILVDWQQLGGIWPLPVPDAFGVCNDMNPVRWLLSTEEESCTRYANISSICETYLKASSYVSDLVVSKLPSVSTTETVQIDTGTTYVRDLDLMVDIDGSVANTNLQGCVCQNALLEAHYSVFYNSDQDEPESIIADIVVGNVEDEDCSSGEEPIFVQQKFSVKFYSESSSDDTFDRSGNPGYQVGYPLIAANSNLNLQEGGFVLSGTSPSGTCSSSTQQSSISPVLRFRHQTIVSCYQEYSKNQLQNNCLVSNAQNPIFQVHDQLAFIGKFGSIDPENQDDWVGIEVNSTVEARYSNGNCTVSNTLVYDIYTAQIGAIANSQPKIVKVNRYFKSVPWVFKRKSTSEKQKFFNSVVVNFIEYNQDYDFYQDKEQEYLLVSDDVYYPFRVS